MNPFYNLFYLIYEPIINKTEGSCNGMASTSLLFHFDDMQPWTFDSTVHEAAGFFPRDPVETYTGGSFCSVARPKNLWAHIRTNHGVQLSEEFLNYAIDDAGVANFVDRYGDPIARYNEILPNPSAQVLCIGPDDITKGHCVVPYEVENDTIWVYDNNTPWFYNDTDRNKRIALDRKISIDRSTNEFTFDKFKRQPSGRYELTGTWRGTRMITIPSNVWRESRSMPGLQLLGKLLYVVSFGDADPLYSTPDGGEWGWTSAGNLIQKMPGAVANPAWGEVSENFRAVTLAIPVSKGPPTVQVSARGGDFRFHAAQGGRIMQLEALDLKKGDEALLSLGYNANRLASLKFSPKSNVRRALPRVGLVLGEGRSAVFKWSGLSVRAGGSVEFSALSTEPGVRFTNNTGILTQQLLVVEHVDGPAAIERVQIFGPFSVPVRATHRAVLLNWPEGTELRSDLDLDGDGSVDRSETVKGRSCVVPTKDANDCNQNGLRDVCDIAGGTSLDRDRNSIPDECKDHKAAQSLARRAPSIQGIAPTKTTTAH
jgi:hypothetical protein